MINTGTLNQVVSDAIKEHIETKNRNLYLFEKNKLYDYLGQELVDKFKQHKCFIAGGAITSLFTNSKINDIDVYFRDQESCIEFVKQGWNDRDCHINLLTKKSILIKTRNESGNDIDLQFIHFNYFKSAEEIFDTFDYTVCMGAFDFVTEQFVLHDEFLKHNSQRILKFNKNTAFPIVSLLRVSKYNKKSYTISKPEFLRIVMKCMDLKINNVDELKDHLGGMYGINYDKIINFNQDEEFSLVKVIDRIENLSLDEDYFKVPEETKFDDLDDVINTIKKQKCKITIINDVVYKIKHNNTLKKLNTKPVYYDEVLGKDYVEKNKFYKFVIKEDIDTYASHWDNDFKYEIGKKSTAKGDYLYFNERNEIQSSSYRNKGSLIEVEIKLEDFIRKDGSQVLAKSCKVIREVPKEEYENWNEEINDDYDDDIPWS